MSKLKVAVVGAGILGSRHARVFHEQAESETVAVVDPDGERATTLATKLGVRSYPSLERLWDAEPVDVLAVATPDHIHRAPVLEAIARGKHVFLEKPLATNAADIDAILAASADAGVTVMVNYSQRFVAEYAAIKKLVDDGAIGRPAMVTTHKFDTLHVPTKMIGWAAATSPIFFMSSHDLDLVQWYLGKDPVEVVAQDRRGVLDAEGIKVHDGLNALVRFGDDVIANVHSSWIHPNTYPVLADGFMQIIGSEGVLFLNNRARRLEMFNRRGTFEQVFAGPHTANEVEGKLAGAFTEAVRHFIAAARDGREPDTSPRRTAAIARMQVAIIESLAKKGTPVRVGH